MKKDEKKDSEHGFWTWKIDGKSLIIGELALITLLFLCGGVFIFLYEVYKIPKLEDEISRLQHEVEVLREINSIDFNLTKSVEIKDFVKDCEDVGGDSWWSDSGYRECTIYGYSQQDIINLNAFCKVKELEFERNKGFIKCCGII